MASVTINPTKDGGLLIALQVSRAEVAALADRMALPVASHLIGRSLAEANPPAPIQPADKPE